MQHEGRVETLADHVGSASVTRDLSLILAASVAVGLLAQVQISLAWTPVPITLQPFGVFLAGAALGSRRGALAMLAYLAEGAAGLPFFAGGSAGIAHLLGPTGGYLFGFVPTAFAIGFLAERGWDRSPLKAFLAMCVGSVVLFACGLAQLAAFVPRSELLRAGFTPFLVGDLIKMLAAAALLPSVWKILERGGWIRH
ncbi:MAG TPA: biotin transporter BioY [Candidatus Krumholzibacteria bacterium]|nr:biotin transporter BioY [Candidatus Krumholzibacteria bacterium]